MSADAGCVHDVLLFGSDEELAAAGSRFISAGIAAGDLVVVHGPDHDVEVLRSVFHDDPRVTFAPGTSRYRTMMGTIGAYQRLCERENAAGRRVRATGPVPFGQDPTSRAEWMRYEALVDRALAPYRFSGLCQYDLRFTPPELLDFALATHGNVVTADGRRPNERLPTTGVDLRDLEPRAPAQELEREPPVLAEIDCIAAAPVRHGVHQAVRAGGVASERAHEFATAVSEVVTNALEHGHPPVQVRLHSDGRRWLCVVIDHGPGIADPWAGVDSPLPRNPGRNGTGLWVARQLCHQLTISDHPGGGARVELLWTPGPGEV